MGTAGGTVIQAGAEQRRRVVVDVILLLVSNDRILLRERANTGYGDGAYEPPSGQLADRETIVETAIRVAWSQAGIAVTAENVSLAHVMHDVSGSGRIAFFLAVAGWQGECSSPGTRWFPLGDLPRNMLDRARVALANYAEGMRFSTYPRMGGVGSFPPPGGAGSFPPPGGAGSFPPPGGVGSFPPPGGAGSPRPRIGWTGDGRDPERAWLEERHLRGRHDAQRLGVRG
jgi:8-oxo-dGTP pyrophosphatase MutT (NUDIX family)